MKPLARFTVSITGQRQNSRKWHVGNRSVRTAESDFSSLRLILTAVYRT